MGTVVASPDVAVAAVPPGDGSCALAGAYLWMAADGVSVGAARGISLGHRACVGDRYRRKGGVRYFVFRTTGRKSLCRRSRGDADVGQLPDQSRNASHARTLLEQRRFVAWIGRDCGVSRRGDQVATLSRPELRALYSNASPESLPRAEALNQSPSK